ncbi:hypothetical protein [Mesorhizobium sp. M4A.F.Ca.ET.050.02.1.1]|uniref:hypothetical protein n=1 Tax=Mesorhizobium sp. M4A.F.Ca.ET.050.02.1.1 TaxID=2496754 RepID=UPI00247A114F|nr:hypothetical protein [Mesorhizobium sp. M4A.F.Ca.ET.050.02.1.1]
MRTDKRLTNRLARAKLRLANASIEDIDFSTHRGLDRRKVLSLAQGARHARLRNACPRHTEIAVPI